MSSYTIVGVADQVRDWNSTAGGPMKAYRIDLRDGDVLVPLVEWSRKASSPAPVEGQEVEGEVEDAGAYGLKFRKAQGGGYGGSPRPEDPKRSAHIARMHAQEMALRYAMVRADKELLPDNFTLEQLRKVIDWFTSDAQQARDAA